ncbi:MAG: serpin family protein [candidate division WOR-3 bacterium]
MNIILILTLITSPLKGAESKTSGANLVPAKNRFGFRLLTELSRGEIKENIVLSPYSIASALTMTYNGAAGETRAAMARALEIEGIGLDELNQGEKGLFEALQQKDARLQLVIANSLWARKGIGFKPGFINRVKKFFSAEVNVLDFNSPEALVKINSWVREKTRGKIERIVERIVPDAVLYLINAVYFKGKWQQGFDPKQTYETDFHLSDGTKKRVMMMYRSDRFSYLAGDGFQAVKLPYGDGRMSMVVFLPDESLGLNGLITRLTGENYAIWQREFASRQGEVGLPRFKLEYEGSLNEPLKVLGMAIAFDLNIADFSEMSPMKGVAIGDVRHKSFIEVNEEGTEAAAVTSVEMVMTAMPVDRFRMICDRPFLFTIEDNRTGAILFLGAVVKP